MGALTTKQLGGLSTTALGNFSTAERTVALDWAALARPRQTVPRAFFWYLEQAWRIVAGSTAKTP